MKRIFAALALASAMLAPFSAFGETESYTMTYKEILDQAKETVKISEVSGSFNVTVNGVEWTFSYERTKKPANSSGYVTLKDLGSGKLSFDDYDYTAVTISTDAFSDKAITNISGKAAVIYNSTSSCELTIGGKTYNDKQNNTEFGAWNSTVNPQVFDLPAGTCGPFSLKYTISDTQGGAFYFEYLTITFATDTKQTTAAPGALISVPVGHPVDLVCDDADAEIFYAINDDENFQPYNHETGITFTEPGTYTVSYYSQAEGKNPSETVSETVTVVRPSRLSHAISLYDEVTVSGYLTGISDDFVLIGASAADSADSSLAIESKSYAELPKASIGSLIEVTGRPTDRFGRPALGSISALNIDGRAQTPTSIVTTPQVKANQEFYDLQGRRDVASSKPRIVVSANGTRMVAR